MTQRPEQGGGLPFEATDFATARRALDEPPAGLEVARQLQSPNWESRRRPAGATDHAILGRTVDWILNLDPDARPAHLADAIPRIANALAERWSDPGAAGAYVTELLIDRRGGRKGFPVQIKKELVMLHLVLRRSRPRNPPAVR
jgi:hypothetical protein